MATCPIAPSGVDVYASRRKWANPSSTPTYFSWRSMRARCCSKKNASWDNYGGRGIKVCDRWMQSYDAFVEDMGLRPDGMTLDRIDNDGPYSPENCRWASWKTQRSNKRCSKYITHDGVTLTVAQWAARLGINTDTLWKRLFVHNIPISKAMTAKSLVPTTRCGTRHAYEKGCRCDDCKSAHAARHREMRQRRKQKHNCGGEIATEAAE